jgi:hypothetical protein
MGHNEMLLGRAPGPPRSSAISVKFGATRSGRCWSGYDARPAAVRNFRLHSETPWRGTHRYLPPARDSTVLIEETIGAIADLVKADMSAPSASEVGL